MLGGSFHSTLGGGLRLSSPTEDAFLSAVECGRGHLNALMCFYAVELLLVTRAVIDERFIEPSTSFHCGMSPNEVVLLSS